MDFISFARAHGVEINPTAFYPSLKIRRCGTSEKPRSLNGAYFWDGVRGWVMDWSTGSQPVWYKEGKAAVLDEGERRQYAARWAQERDAQQERYERAAQRAEEDIRGARLKHHPYLAAKGFPNEKGLVLDGALLVPMRNPFSDKLQGYQSITWDEATQKSEKKMLTGMRAKGAVLLLGDRKEPEKWLVEGFVTGLSVRDALRSCGLSASVVVCFSAGNLVNIARTLGGTRLVFADNDASGTGQKAAEETGLPWTMCPIVGLDANDSHLRNGLISVVRRIVECRRAAKVFG